MTASKTEEARLLRPDIRLITVPIEGLSPLICHAWSDKAIKMMLDKQTQRATGPKEAKDPDSDFRATLYPIDDEVYGYPAGAFKKAIVRAGTYSDMKMTFLRGALYVVGDLVRIDGKPRSRRDMVRVARGAADIRYRAEFPDWRASLDIQYNARAVSAEQIVNLVATAGFSVGIGDWRPEHDGSYGRFRVVTAE
jgi:hypothetical protein